MDLPGGMWAAEPPLAVPPNQTVPIAARSRSIGGVKGSFSFAQDGDNMRTYVVTFDMAATAEHKIAVSSVATAPGAKDPLKIEVAPDAELTDTVIKAKVIITNA